MNPLVALRSLNPWAVASSFLLSLAANTVIAALTPEQIQELVNRDGPPTGLPDMAHIPNAIPRVEKALAVSMRPYMVFGRRYRPLKTSTGYVEQGTASWYGKQFHGNKTAIGETYDMYAMTAAHKTLPLPSYVEVINLDNNKRVTVRLNDRGPFYKNRLIDLSYAAADKLGMIQSGTARVEIRSVYAIAKDQIIADNDRMPSSTEIYLQLGVFGEFEAAQRLQARMGRYLSRPIRIEEADTDLGHVMRVQVGPLDSMVIADEVMAMLRDVNVNHLQLILR